MCRWNVCDHKIPIWGHPWPVWGCLGPVGQPPTLLRARSQTLAITWAMWPKFLFKGYISRLHPPPPPFNGFQPQNDPSALPDLSSGPDLGFWIACRMSSLMGRGAYSNGSGRSSRREKKRNPLIPHQHSTHSLPLHVSCSADW